MLHTTDSYKTLFFDDYKPYNLKSMTKKTNLVVIFLGIFNELKIVMKFTTMLLLIGTIQTSVATGMSDSGIVSINDLQQKQVNGRITDAGGNSLTGVNIMEKGTNNGVISDQNGNYAIMVTSPNSILSFSFIGYTTQEITVGTQLLSIYNLLKTCQPWMRL